MVGLFSAFRNWQERRIVIRDIEQRAATDTMELSYVINDELAVALEAIKREDYAPALKIWTGLVNRHPRETRGSRLALDVLIGLKGFDEAEALARQGVKNHPGEAHYLRGLMRIAKERRDWDELFKCSAILRKRSPGDPDGYLMPADALRSMNRLDEAEGLTRLATKRAGHHVLSLSGHAEVAFQRGDWNEAMKRFQSIVEMFDHTIGHYGLARTLHKMGRDADAEAILLRQADRVPSDASIRIELARLAQGRGEIDLAIERWSYVGGRYTTQLVPCMLAAEALQQLGAMDKSERILRFTAESFRGDHWPLGSLAALLSGQKRYAEAGEVWATVRQSFPDMESGYIKGADALESAGFPDKAGALRREWQALRTTLVARDAVKGNDGISSRPL